MSTEDIIYLSATDMISGFRSKTLSPVEVMQATIDRAEQVEPEINALSHTFFDRALEQAQESETRYQSGQETGPLEGLPVGIKDETAVTGMPCTNGSLTLKDQVMDFTSVNNQRILDAGGIMHARTTTPEFSCSGVTQSRLWGVTRNPWNQAFTPGGSSGGASASLAAGTSTIATGSDIGGSIRIPASAGGVVGFKPPYGRNPEDPPFNLDFYCHTGPMARSVSDVRLLQNVMCGPHTSDIASLKPKLVLPENYETIKGWKIAYSMNLGFYEVEEEVVNNTLEALDVFRSLGATVEEVEIGWTSETLKAGLDYLNHLFGYGMYETYEKYGDLLTTYATKFALNGKSSTNKEFWDSYKIAGAMYKTLGPILDSYNLFVCPTNNLASVPAEHDQSCDEVIINGKQVDPLLGWVMTLPFNMLSRCPVMSVPSGRRKDHVPTGIQLVGPTYEDQTVFQAATAFESAVGGWYGDTSNRPAL